MVGLVDEYRLGRGYRLKQPSSYSKDHVTHTALCISPSICLSKPVPSLVEDLPLGMKAIDSKWVYKMKYSLIRWDYRVV